MVNFPAIFPVQRWRRNTHQSIAVKDIVIANFMDNLSASLFRRNWAVQFFRMKAIPTRERSRVPDSISVHFIDAEFIFS